MTQQDVGHKVKVFISWSGERSKALAEALHDWIPLVLHYVEPWLSEADIAAGDRWADAIAKELETSNFGIICVTRENVATPWVIFEAGALAKSMGSRVIPLLLDLEFRDIAGPLAQFQAKKVERGGLSEVIGSVNQAANHAVPEARAKQLFEALWPELEKRVAAIPKQAQAAKPARPQHEVLEELVASVRTLDSRFREVIDTLPRASRGRRFRIHPEMVMELRHMLGEGPDDSLSVLVLASLLREDFPWLYELGMEAYRAVRLGPEEGRYALQRFQRACKMLMRGPFFSEDSAVDPRMLDMLLHELGRFQTPEPVAEEDAHATGKRKKPTKAE